MPLSYNMKKLLAAVFVLFISCTQSINKNVEAAMQHYDSLILHTDAKGIAAMFTANGEMAPHGMNPIRGRDSIEKFLQQFQGIVIEAQKSTTDSIHKVADTAYQYGKYYQRAKVNNTIAEIHGMFEAKWVIQPGGKLLLKRMSAWSVNN